MKLEAKALSPIIHNTFSHYCDENRYLHLQRFSQKQQAVYQQVSPDFELRVRSSASVTLDFITDSEFVSMDFDLYPGASHLFRHHRPVCGRRVLRLPPYRGSEPEAGEICLAGRPASGDGVSALVCQGGDPPGAAVGWGLCPPGEKKPQAVGFRRFHHPGLYREFFFPFLCQPSGAAAGRGSAEPGRWRLFLRRGYPG